MSGVGTVIIGVLVSAVGLILGLTTRGLRHEFAEFRQEMAEFRKEIKADLRATEQRLDGRIDGFQRALATMRSDLTQMALAVGVKPRASNG
jgi:CHASE1-domain containing sensor protein